MAVDKLVDSTQLDSDLTSVANAIRTKGGTSAQLAFPAGFVSAVQAIPTGVTPTGTKQISITANGQTTEDVTNYASAQITASVPNTYSAGDEGKVVDDGALVAQTSTTVTINGTYNTTTNNEVVVNVAGQTGILLTDVLNRTISGDVEFTVTGQPTPGNNANGSQFYNMTFNALFQQVPGITKLTIHGLKWVPGSFMRMTGTGNVQNNPAITEVSMPDALFCGQRAFQGCVNMVKANFPAMAYSYSNNTEIGSNMFNGCYKLEVAEMNTINRVCATMFADCRALNAVILRKSDAVAALSNVSGFNNTPLRGYGGTYSGHVYVPQALIASYQTASNWATLYAAYPDIFKAIEGSDYE